jgi:hypothetical protein
MAIEGLSKISGIQKEKLIKIQQESPFLETGLHDMCRIANSLNMTIRLELKENK